MTEVYFFVDLQQTPATAAKVMLKIFAQAPSASAPETHTFHFTSPTSARSEADTIKEALSNIIQTARAGSAPGTPGATGPGGSSAAMSIAHAVSSGKRKNGSIEEEIYDDERLRADLDLQQSLLQKDSSLRKTFMESLRTKPDSIAAPHFTSQFWSTRTHLLRSHAIEKNQTRGDYNVLSTMKPKQVDGELTIKISPDQIMLIFKQHPLVKRVYDENVPKPLSETSFWTRFFTSRLCKKLKGEKINEQLDASDPVLDKYLKSDDEYTARGQMADHIPHIIDLEGNEENHSQRQGNRPDMTMRPTSHDKVPIIRTLNNLSERLMENVAPADVNPADPIGMDEETFNELALRDLQADSEESRVLLNIKEQRRFLGDDDNIEASNEALLYAKQDPTEVLSDLRLDLDTMTEGSNGILDLQAAIGVDDRDDSDDEGQHHAQHVGSKAAIADAQSQIMSSIAQRRSQIDDFSSSAASGVATIQTSISGLTGSLFERLTLTHATTTEFLHHFWLVFLSGDPDRAGEVGQLIESLNRAVERINAVAADADIERIKDIAQRKQAIRDHYEKTGKKKRLNENLVKGGAAVVHEMMQPTEDAIKVALAEYAKAKADDETSMMKEMIG
jgi:transcription initiation factor TFIIH subunit 1